jgi:hypothetical protein
MSSNQGLWANFGAVEELTEQAAEAISGGAESFLLYNGTNIIVNFTLDGNLIGLKPDEGAIFTTSGNGIISFDEDVRSGIQSKSYNLADGGRYGFGVNLDTASNPYDLDLGNIA